MRAHLPLLALAVLLPACAMERPPLLTAPPVGAQAVRLCATVDGKVRDFTGWIDPATGDTMVSGGRFHERFPTAYAAGRAWFDRNERMPKPGSWYRKYGQPRELTSDDLRTPGLKAAYRVDDLDLLVANDQETSPNLGGEYEIVYVLVHAGCIFQPYINQVTTGGVRDDVPR